MKIKKPDSQPQNEAIEVTPEPIAHPPTTFAMEYDDEAGTVDFELEDGTLVRLQSPTKKQLWTITGWLSSCGDDQRNDLMLLLKLAQVCCVRWGESKSISFDQMLEELEPADFKRLGAAIACFRDRVEDFFGKLGMAGAGPKIPN